MNAELSEDVIILTQPAPKLIQFGLVKPGTLYQCTKACYVLREAPKLWEEARDKTLTSFVFQIDNVEYSLRQSTHHPNLWFVRAPCQHLSKKVRLPDDSDLPDITVFGEHEHAAAFLVYVDDFLAAGPRDVLQPILTRLLDMWKGSNPDFLGRQPGPCDFLVSTFNWVQKRAQGLYINRATSMPSFKRCSTQSVLRIDELQVNQTLSPTNLMTKHMHRKHVSSIHHYNQDRIPLIILQSCVLLVCCYGYP